LEPKKQKKLYASEDLSKSGLRLGLIRKEANLDQRALLDKLGLGTRSLSMISKWETGKVKRLNDDLLMCVLSWVDDLGYSIRWFMLGRGPEREEKRARDAQQEILEQIERLTDKLNDIKHGRP
jgi:transcriptional regulator with XRE-family HTH domain